MPRFCSRKPLTAASWRVILVAGWFLRANPPPCSGPDISRSMFRCGGSSHRAEKGGGRSQSRQSAGLITLAAGPACAARVPASLRPRRKQVLGGARGPGKRSNALKGRRLSPWLKKTFFLSQWEENVADKRIHGTTCKQVAARFEEQRPHLQALPTSLFPCYQQARRNISGECFVEVQRAFYEAPPEYIGRQVWVRWDSRCVRIFNDRIEQVGEKVSVMFLEDPATSGHWRDILVFRRSVPADISWLVARARGWPQTIRRVLRC